MNELQKRVERMKNDEMFQRWLSHHSDTFKEDVEEQLNVMNMTEKHDLFYKPFIEFINEFENTKSFNGYEDVYCYNEENYQKLKKWLEYKDDLAKQFDEALSLTVSSRIEELISEDERMFESSLISMESVKLVYEDEKDRPSKTDLLFTLLINDWIGMRYNDLRDILNKPKEIENTEYQSRRLIKMSELEWNLNQNMRDCHLGTSLSFKAMVKIYKNRHRNDYRSYTLLNFMEEHGENISKNILPYENE